MAQARRIDQWLFFARVVKTRSLAQKLVEAGHVRINKAKIHKPGYAINPGDIITVALHGHVKVLKVLDPGTRRGPATEAQDLYEDLSPPAAFPV